MGFAQRIMGCGQIHTNLRPLSPGICARSPLFLVYSNIQIVNLKSHGVIL